MSIDSLLDGLEQDWGGSPIKKWETWTQADGTEISVGAMSEQHLRNTLNAILRKRRERIEQEFKQAVRTAIREPAWWRKYDEE